MMFAGGPKEAYDAMKPILERVAAISDSGPCVAYLGKGGAGNYVKMVHNGIEYGDMQLIAETYDLLQNAGMRFLQMACVPVKRTCSSYPTFSVLQHNPNLTFHKLLLAVTRRSRMFSTISTRVSSPAI